MLSLKRRLFILRVYEIMPVHRLCCEAKLPYLNIYRMIILPVDKFMLLLIWSLDSDVSAIKAFSDTWKTSHGVEFLLLVIGLCMCQHLYPVPDTQHQCVSHSRDGTTCCWLINTDQIAHYALKASSCVELQNQTHLQNRWEWPSFSGGWIQCLLVVLWPGQIWTVSGTGTFHILGRHCILPRDAYHLKKPSQSTSHDIA